MDYQSGTKDANGDYVLERAYYSDYGSCKDISAPGSDICSTIPMDYNFSTYGGYAYLSGTSMASPMVAGTVALIFAKNSSLSADEVLNYLYSSALDLGDEGYDIYYGWGCIDMAAALEETPYESLVPVPKAPSAVTYNGMPQTADIPTSKFYTITNATYTDAGTYTVTVSLNDKENYTWNDEGLTTDDLQFEFVINKAHVTLAAVNASKSYGAADPLLAGSISGLAKDGDLGIISFVREEGEDVGEYVITAIYTDNANYDVTINPATFTINPANISVATVTFSDDAYPYTGAAQTPDPIITRNGDVLVKGIDYTLRYTDNVDAGTAGVIVSGVGNYTGTTTATFEIAKAHAMVICADAHKAHGADDPVLGGSVEGLIGDDDLGEVVYTREGGEDIGTYVISATYAENGNYDVTVVDGIFTITQSSIDGVKVSGVNEEYTYDGHAIEPVPTIALPSGVVLVEGLDYAVSYENNINAGTATVIIEGCGGYSGEVNCTFTITAVDISNAAITGVADSYTYTGSQICPRGYMVAMNDVMLTEEVDFTVTYGSNISVGEGSVVFTGIGNYAGSIIATFEVTAASIEQANVLGIDDYYVYTGEAIKPIPTVETGDGVVLREGVDYTLAYANNTDVGTAKITITGIGNYASTLVCEFKILRSFADVGPKNDDNSWYFDAIYSLVFLNVISGYGPDYVIFGVGDPITRADFVTMLWRYCEPEEYANYDPSTTHNTTDLPDVEDGQYWTQAVNWAVENGVVTGYDLGDGYYEFMPYNSMSFEETVTVLARYVLGFDAAASYDTSVLSEPRFNDADTISGWARGAMSWAIDNDLVTGNNNGDGTYSIDPLSSVPRERMATVLWRSIDVGLVQPD